MTRIIRNILALVMVLGTTAPAIAQSAFSAAIQVNDDTITFYEIEQRKKLMRVLRAPGNLEQAARDALIEDKLKLAEARKIGLRPEGALIDQGIEDLAGNNGLTGAQLLSQLSNQGIAPETFKSYVAANVLWREVVRARFGSRGNVSEAEVDRALTATQPSGGIRVLISEIILPLVPQLAVQSRRQATQVRSVRSTAEFSALARKLSFSASRANGGRLDWMNLSDLPAPLRPILLALRPGQVSEPIEVPNALILFQLRALEEGSAAAPATAAVDYAQFLLPENASGRGLKDAARIAGRLDQCDDLYGYAKGLPKDRLVRESVAPSQLAPDVAIELAKLDRNETSVQLTRNDGQTRVLLMLCGRTTKAAGNADRETVRAQLRQQRLSSIADSFLAEIKADARIRQ